MAGSRGAPGPCAVEPSSTVQEAADAELSWQIRQACARSLPASTGRALVTEVRRRQEVSLQQGAEALHRVPKRGRYRQFLLP